MSQYFEEVVLLA